MKQLIPIFILLMLTFSLAHATDFNVNSINLKGNSNTGFGNYEIKELPPVNMNGESMRTFELTYEKAQKTVLIYLDERANCRDYIVRSKNLEVKYECKKTSFGVQLLSNRQMKYNPVFNKLFLSQEEFEKQQKISEGALPIDSALGLIASYYPNLLKSPDLLN
jgi:hypothetical protein